MSRLKVFITVTMLSMLLVGCGKVNNETGERLSRNPVSTETDARTTEKESVTTENANDADYDDLDFGEDNSEDIANKKNEIDGAIASSDDNDKSKVSRDSLVDGKENESGTKTHSTGSDKSTTGKTTGTRDGLSKDSSYVGDDTDIQLMTPEVNDRIQREYEVWRKNYDCSKNGHMTGQLEDMTFYTEYCPVKYKIRPNEGYTCGCGTICGIQQKYIDRLRKEYPNEKFTTDSLREHQAKTEYMPCEWDDGTVTYLPVCAGWAGWTGIGNEVTSTKDEPGRYVVADTGWTKYYIDYETCEICGYKDYKRHGEYWDIDCEPID